MSKPRKDEPLKMPRYRGGDEALRRFISDNLNYPEEALSEKIEGAVEAAYDVDGNGRIVKVEILKSLGYGCDEEVIRLIKLLKFEKAYNKGRRVTSHKKLKVDFKLPVRQKEQKIQYHITGKQKEPENHKGITKSGNSYGYTITIN